MANFGAIFYPIELAPRSLCAVEAETDKVQFLVGTQGLKSKLTNQVPDSTAS